MKNDLKGCRGCGVAIPARWRSGFCGGCHGQRVMVGKGRAKVRQMRGVDIDAIHFKLGKVKKVLA